MHPCQWNPISFKQPTLHCWMMGKWMLKASMSRALSEPPQPRPMSTPQLSSGMFTQVSAAQGRNDLCYSFLNNLISLLGSEWLLHLYIFGGWSTNTIFQQSWKKVLFSMKRVEEEEKRKKYSWWKVLFPIKWVVGGRRRKKKMEKWRKSIIFNQTRGGWRRWLPHTWHSCRTEAPGQLHPNIVIVVITIVIVILIS